MKKLLFLGYAEFMRTVIVFFIVLAFSGCAFKTPMDARITGDGKYWVILAPLKYEHPDTKKMVTVPRGFVTDLASVPRLFWIAFPPCGKYTPAAVVHDYLYWTQPIDCNQECADNILLMAMKESNVNVTTRNAIYFAVRAAGKDSLRKNRKAKDEGAIRDIPEEVLLKLSSSDTWEEIEKRIRALPTNE